MLHHDKRWLKSFGIVMLISIFAVIEIDARRSNANLTACQHLRRAETRRSKALQQSSHRIRVPRCSKKGEFAPVQCMNEKSGEDCWCVDDFGVEVPGTRNATKASVRCVEPDNCPSSACRMFCPAGFARDAKTGCSVCRCRDVCDGVDCPHGQTCQVQEIKCKAEPCPPVPTCKKSRSIANYCPAGLPLAIEDSVRPFLCGLEPGKPTCPPLYQCVIESGNDYGVCCPSHITFQKPGVCPTPDKMDYTKSTGVMCGSPCTNDLECRNMEKCCFTKGCQYNCQQPYNVTTCHQARALSEALAINEREGRGYVPDCSGTNGMFSPRQCSRNGLVCWCVNPRSGEKIPNTMGAAKSVQCDGWENMIGRSFARSFDTEKCDTNICAAICEYGFKNDHNGCPTCECSEPCDGFKCAMGSHCEVATDPLCESGSPLCASWPVCKPDLAYSNPCDVGTPLSDIETGEVKYCYEERQSRAYQPLAFFEPGPELKQARSMSNRIMCPENYKCTKLHRETESVCCPLPEENTKDATEIKIHQQTMCEYLRDFSERMEGTEEGMQLAVPAPYCTDDGNYRERQCMMKKVKVTRAEQRKILEENTIRRMRMLLEDVSRPKRDVERLRLYRVDDSALKIQVAPPIMMGRSAKVIDIGVNRERQQGLGQLFEADLKKVATAPKLDAQHNDELVEIEVEECWCVDNFGTEIPRSRGFNVTDQSCIKLREEIECLDLTCRMGCEYGFTLDPDTRCPACQCRDPCESVSCDYGKECRIVDVTCDEEYCPPVPACLPRKPGQCPFLVPPGSDNLDANTCAYECRTDTHCEGTKRCCSNGCGTQCVQPQMKTACQHLQAIQKHQSSELGIPAMKMYIAQCDAHTGKWRQQQCSPDGYCWCVDGNGEVLSGTRVKGDSPICKLNSAYECKPVTCDNKCSESGYKVDENSCQTCECRNFCEDISCSNSEECQLINVECIDGPCPKMPICVPRRESVCPEGSPFKQGDLEVSCGPQNENELCPTTHTCQLNPVTHRGVCCTKTRDVCFESTDKTCLANDRSERNITKYRFSPKANKCVPIIIDQAASSCQTKNLFHSEIACNSVCPVLTQCERLKLKNSLAAQHTGHTSVWFQPRCDPITGHWSPVQCLGKQAREESSRSLRFNFVGVSRTFHTGPNERAALSSSPNNVPYGVCWCADKKGAPLRGTMTRDAEPMCNSRQGRVYLEQRDPLMEELIMQLALFNNVDSMLEENISENEESQEITNEDNLTVESQQPTVSAEASATERVLEMANSLLDSKFSVDFAYVKPLTINQTRCQAFSTGAPYRVDCDADGNFVPIQCNGNKCWCVDEAGNQVDSSHVFVMESYDCEFTPIQSVAIELHLRNQTHQIVRNLYDTIRMELLQLLGEVVENLRVLENFDGTVLVRFELHNRNKVNLAFAIEMAAIRGELEFGKGHYRPDITRSKFVHHLSSEASIAQAVSKPEHTLQLVLFIMATSSAFLVSVFVVYVMLKRGKRKIDHGNYAYPIYPSESKNLGGGDKVVDFSAPIFVLSSASNAINDYNYIKPSIDDNFATEDAKIEERKISA